MISREDLIAQSIQDYVKDELYGATFNYSTDRVEVIDGYDEYLFSERYGTSVLTKTLAAMAIQFDNGGRQMELGGSLRQFLHTVDFLVFGHTANFGRNIAHIIRAILANDSETIPLLDYNVATSPRPEIDRLIVESVAVERQQIYDPRPWQQNAWRTRLRVTDEVYAITAA